MQPRRIVIANKQRLLREMLKRVIEKTPHFQVVGEVSGWMRLARAVEETDADWVIVSLDPDGELPREAEALLAAHPTVRVLAMTADAGQVKLKWVESSEESLTNLSLPGLLDVLRQESPWEVNPAT